MVGGFSRRGRADRRYSSDGGEQTASYSRPLGDHEIKLAARAQFVRAVGQARGTAQGPHRWSSKRDIDAVAGNGPGSQCSGQLDGRLESHPERVSFGTAQGEFGEIP